MLLLGSALMLNRGALTDVDPMTGQEVFGTASALFLCSISLYRILCDTWVEVRTGWVDVRNPVHRYSIPVSQVVEIQWKQQHWPRLLIASGRKIKLLGVQQSTMDLMAGGSGEMKNLLRTLEEVAAEGCSTEGHASRGISRMTWGLGSLLFAWALYGISFIPW
ncbi:hypothetical protein [Arsenicicoccus dermatophilus]|uniref:hypothetical protein n=1 Tax=Arsenicicoccus dermatophilus TaxID=1076331 RepID=UPI0039173CC7